jgi:hypothetical protein
MLLRLVRISFLNYICKLLWLHIPEPKYGFIQYINLHNLISKDSKFVPLHDTKAYWGRGSIAGGEMSTSRPGRFILGKEARYPLNREMGGPQSRPGRLWDEENPLSLPGFEPWTVQPISGSCTDYPFTLLFSMLTLNNSELQNSFTL